MPPPPCPVRRPIIHPTRPAGNQSPMNPYVRAPRPTYTTGFFLRRPPPRMLFGAGAMLSKIAWWRFRAGEPRTVLGPADATGRCSMLDRYDEPYMARCCWFQVRTSVPATWPCGLRYWGPRSTLPSFSSTTSMLVWWWRSWSSRRSVVAKPEMARAVTTSGPAKGPEREDEIEG
ncbi:hypothetical protein VTN02DRAFT_476 [Thermoascus thermophilus]